MIAAILLGAGGDSAYESNPANGYGTP